MQIILQKLRKAFIKDKTVTTKRIGIKEEG